MVDIECRIDRSDNRDMDVKQRQFTMGEVTIWFVFGGEQTQICVDLGPHWIGHQ